MALRLPHGFGHQFGNFVQCRHSPAVQNSGDLMLTKSSGQLEFFYNNWYTPQLHYFEWLVLARHERTCFSLWGGSIWTFRSTSPSSKYKLPLMLWHNEVSRNTSTLTAQSEWIMVQAGSCYSCMPCLPNNSTTFEPLLNETDKIYRSDTSLVFRGCTLRWSRQC